MYSSALRIIEREMAYWADPGHDQPGEINTWDGGRGVYFDDPSGHRLEIITPPTAPAEPPRSTPTRSSPKRPRTIGATEHDQPTIRRNATLMSKALVEPNVSRRATSRAPGSYCLAM